MIYVAVLLWFGYAVAVMTREATDVELFTQPLRSLVCTSINTLTVCSVMVHVAARVVRGQRRLMERIEALETDPAPSGYAEGYADGLRAPHPASGPTLVKSRP